MTETSCYILDNGAYTAKVGFSSMEPKIVPNCIMKAKSERRRPFIGSQIDDCRDASGLFYILPFQKGFLINWDTQKTVWDYIFSKECCPVNFNETPLIITEPLFNFSSVQEAMTEIFFEEYECQSLLRINATDLAEYGYRNENKNQCTVVVDSGYSYTYIVPYINGKKYREGKTTTLWTSRLMVGHPYLVNFPFKLSTKCFQVLFIVDKALEQNSLTAYVFLNTQPKHLHACRCIRICICVSSFIVDLFPLRFRAR